MVGERYINPVDYLTGQDGGDNEIMYVGFDNDTTPLYGRGAASGHARRC